MRFNLLICSALACLISCNSHQQKDEQPAGINKDFTQNPAYLAGIQLMSKSDCPTCHKPEEPGAGPSFKAIAGKYPNTAANIDTLAGKIIRGGSGNWGTIPMAAHPSLSESDAKAMVNFIMMHK